MTEISKGRQLHQQALNTQEAEDFEGALKLIDSALVAYATDKDELGFAEAHTMRYLTLNHLHKATGFEGWLVSAKFSAQAGVELARRSDNPKALGIPLFHLAEVQGDLGEYDKALSSYNESIDVLGVNPENGAYIANIKNHMEVCAYKSGDMEAIKRAESALSELESLQNASEYDHQVWISGGYLRIADALRSSDPEVGKEFLEKARAYIEAHPELKLRKKQWEKLASKFE